MLFFIERVFKVYIRRNLARVTHICGFRHNCGLPDNGRLCSKKKKALVIVPLSPRILLNFLILLFCVKRNLITITTLLRTFENARTQRNSNFVRRGVQRNNFVSVLSLSIFILITSKVWPVSQVSCGTRAPTSNIDFQVEHVNIVEFPRARAWYQCYKTTSSDTLSCWLAVYHGHWDLRWCWSILCWQLEKPEWLERPYDSLVACE